MKDRIGVFICECGPNLKKALDIPRLVQASTRLDGVVRAEAVPLLCTPDAGKTLAATIRTMDIRRVVVAGCSPREHEQTFRKVLAEAGLNPFMMQVVNIREQCAWVIPDRDRASCKAWALIRGAIARVRHHDPLAVRQIDCRADVLVVGAGVAGISAARTLAGSDRRVYLVERSACIGGKVALYEDLYPDLNCAGCLIQPDLDAVLHDDHIDVLTLGEVLSVRGYPGNFAVSIKQHPRSIDPQRCIGCGACQETCPVSIANEIDASMNQRAAIGIPYPGALPHLAVVDREHCRRFRGDDCTACRDACAFDAIDFDQTTTTLELAVGAVVIATGFHDFDPDRAPRYGHADLDNVIDAYAFERMINTAGPTGGQIVDARGRPPKQVAFVHCVGSRTDDFNPHCSGVCCLYSFKHARQVKKQLPGAGVHHIFADLCLPGKMGQGFFDALRTQPGITLHRMAGPDAVRIDRLQDRTRLHITDPSGGITIVEADLVVLATALEPPEDAGRTAVMFDIDLDANGFFKEAHPVTAPVASSRDGIYLAGCCQGPKNAPAAVVQGQAAAGAIMQKLVPGGKITLEPVVARVDGDLCSGCRICESLCPFGAVDDVDKDGIVSIQETMCRGCGICAAACPSGAITVCHFGEDTVAAEIDGLLRPDETENP
jgi:heterodisulfide reductase subunit A